MSSTEVAVGLSTWEAALVKHLMKHVETEQELLDSYQQVEANAQAPYASYLIKLIVEDETRHHRLFGELVNALRAPVEHIEGAQVPTVTNATDARALLEATERFLQAERADARALRRLSRRKGLRTMRGHSIWPLLIDLMERDTKKHQEILRFIRKQLRNQLGTWASSRPGY